MTVSGTAAIEDVMEGAMEEMVEVDGGEDVAEVRHLRSASVVVVGAGAIVAAVEAVPLLVGHLAESQGLENLGNFQTLRQTRGPTHTPQGWVSRHTVGEWSLWSRAIFDHLSGSVGGEAAKEEVREGSVDPPKAIEPTDR